MRHAYALNSETGGKGMIGTKVRYQWRTCNKVTHGVVVGDYESYDGRMMCIDWDDGSYQEIKYKSLHLYV